MKLKPVKLNLKFDRWIIAHRLDDVFFIFHSRTKNENLLQEWCQMSNVTNLAGLLKTMKRAKGDTWRFQCEHDHVDVGTISSELSCLPIQDTCMGTIIIQQKNIKFFICYSRTTCVFLPRVLTLPPVDATHIGGLNFLKVKNWDGPWDFPRIGGQLKPNT